MPTSPPLQRKVRSVHGLGGFIGPFGASNKPSFRISLKRRIAMAEEKDKAVDKDLEPKKGSPKIENELSDKEIEKVAGGVQPIDY